ncbi:hypothetical protein [Salipaludibacillus neizhouensis]|uniref:hypothetical protein n=1 Tax=Salipaludibacillus neizhouensis TaxID=885475 RepID=UPI0016035787|nr:hypothetical protein [Salipaludibacillus neizhouensis]
MFNEELEGYAVTVQATLENKRENDVYYNSSNSIGMKLADSFDYSYRPELLCP